MEGLFQDDKYDATSFSSQCDMTILSLSDANFTKISTIAISQSTYYLILSSVIWFLLLLPLWNPFWFLMLASLWIIMVFIFKTIIWTWNILVYFMDNFIHFNRKVITDFLWIVFSSTTCGPISKWYLLHLQMPFLFILSVHGVQTHYQSKWKW